MLLCDILVNDVTASMALTNSGYADQSIKMTLMEDRIITNHLLMSTCSNSKFT